MTDTPVPFPSDAAQPEAVVMDGASALLYWDAPRWNDEPTLAIGSFRCTDPRAGMTLLAQACEMARARGVARVIGPMDGDTWHAYRLVTFSDGSPPFRMEPESGPHDLVVFRASGFVPVSQYVSTRAALTTTIGEPPPPIDGLTIAPWDGRNAQALVGKLFAMSSRAFARNAFYKPITREAFLDLYRPVIPAIDPDLVLFARSADGEIAGFLFALADATPGTVIVKTYASSVRGCGRLLIDTFHRRALAAGFTDVVHALMHEANDSLDRSARTGAVAFRRYALMGRPAGGFPVLAR
ncbi:MAG: hypothetical protein NW217_06080 [Hyphomicrobiaceae bacterium]|nr:hypothetical protein [Hyphomicrobiaceae bacterium]